MLLTISTTHQPATDLGFLLHKSPEKFQTFDLPFGKAHVFYPDAAMDLCTVALLVEVDPVQLVRGKDSTRSGGFALRPYVNDRPYAASSFLSVAIARVFGSALSGKSAARPELAESPIPLRARIPAMPSRSGKEMIERLFAPLGYKVSATSISLDPDFPEWGDGPYHNIELSATLRLRDLLSHLYVLVPVLDEDKHYWVGEDELEKLLRHGGEWLSSHPERAVIANRYLARDRSLAREAVSLLTGDEAAGEEPAPEEHVSLGEQRLAAVLAELRKAGAATVIDLGCGEGRLLRSMLKEGQFKHIVGLDVSHRALERAARLLHFDDMPEPQRRRISLLHGSLTYRDQRMENFDAATVVEVIEHLDPNRLAAFERVLFEFARPGTVILTTPNAEHNVLWETLPAGEFRHPDHRFEWNREVFRTWSSSICERFGYTVQYLPVGPEHPTSGPPTQMAVFTR
ncbi:MAG: 3' terminal RNA ribose 2'-O-methyltransferase Hen1 [Chloroflexota bacterium]